MSWQQAGSIWNADRVLITERNGELSRGTRLAFSFCQRQNGAWFTRVKWRLVPLCLQDTGVIFFFRDPESHWTSCRSKREIYYLKPGLTRLTWMLLWTPLFTNSWAMICKSHHVLFTVEHRKLRKFTVLRKNNKVILKLMAATRLSKVGKRARKVSGIKTKHLEVCFASN